MDYFVLGILEFRSFGAPLRFETQAVSLFSVRQPIKIHRVSRDTKTQKQLTVFLNCFFKPLSLKGEEVW